MPETTPPPGAAATPPATNDGASNETFSIPKAEWESVKKMAESANSLAAELRIMRKKSAETTTTTPATQAAETEEPTTQKETVKKLIEDAKAREARIDAKEKAQMARIRKAGIRQAIMDAGITDADHRDVLETYLEQKHGSKINIDDEDRITVVDDLEQSKDIGDFISDLLKSPKGKLFKPEKAPGPSTRAGRGTSATLPGQKSVMEMSQDELLKLPIADRQRLFAEEAKARGLKI